MGLALALASECERGPNISQESLDHHSRFLIYAHGGQADIVHDRIAVGVDVLDSAVVPPFAIPPIDLIA